MPKAKARTGIKEIILMYFGSETKMEKIKAHKKKPEPKQAATSNKMSFVLFTETSQKSKLLLSFYM